MNIISSKDNELVKNVKKLKDKKYRDLENVYIVEGIKMVKEAILENASIRQIIICFWKMLLLGRLLFVMIVKNLI